MAKFIYNRHFPQEFRNQLSAYIGRVALKVEAEAKSRAPYRTGHLRRSISSFVEQRSEGPVGVVWASAAYAKFVELGARGKGPRSFLRAALKVVGR